MIFQGDLWIGISKFLHVRPDSATMLLDDFRLQRPDELARLDLPEMVEDRHGRKSMIIASQLPANIWYEIIAGPTIADAILDRIVSNAHRIELTGESLRKRK